MCVVVTELVAADILIKSESIYAIFTDQLYLNISAPFINNLVSLHYR